MGFELIEMAVHFRSKSDDGVHLLQHRLDISSGTVSVHKVKQRANISSFIHGIVVRRRSTHF